MTNGFTSVAVDVQQEQSVSAAMDKFKMEAASDVGVPKHETNNNQLPT